MRRNPCPHCGRRVIVGRAAIHLKRECLTEWCQRSQRTHSRRIGRPPDEDLSPEQIERIMARVAQEQRMERARRQP